MKKLTVNCNFWNFFSLNIAGRGVFHFRRTISTGKVQFFQVPFHKKYGVQIYGDYGFACVEDGNERTKLLMKDVMIFPHHYDEEEPDYDEEEMPEPATHWEDLLQYTTWAATT